MLYIINELNKVQEPYGTMPEFLIHFEACAKLLQEWLVCVPLGIYLRQWPKERTVQCQ